MLSIGARMTAAFRLLFTGRLPGDIVAILAQDAMPAADRDIGASPSTATSPVGHPTASLSGTPAAEDRGDRAVQLLALLQREGRLVDFLHEDLAAYSDAQVGAAARDVHGRCRVALDRYIQLVPLSIEDEGESTVVAATTNPASTRIVGNVPAQGTARGILRHRGWRVAQIDLPPLPPGDARRVVAPAEVEVV
jgi:hypothetical protein